MSSERFNPRTLTLSSKFSKDRYWHTSVDGQQPFAGTTAMARSKAQSRDILLRALREFPESAGK